MTDQKHPITPPSELLEQWEDDILNERDNVDHVLDCAWQNGFQAGADAELEACKKVILDQGWFASPGFRLDQLHNARRPGLPISSYQETPTLQEANVGDTLEDGSIVLQKKNGLALLVAPKSTEVYCPWSKGFPEVFQKLKEKGLHPTQWFIPTKEQLELAHEIIPEGFSTAYYWSSTESSTTSAYYVGPKFKTGFPRNKKVRRCVRAFRCVTY